MSSRGLAPAFVFVGGVALASGLLLEFRGELQFSLLLILAGLLLTGAGIGVWAKRASPIRVVLLAACIGITTWPLARYGHIFSEGSTGTSSLLFLAAAAGSLFLLVAAATRL